jgi:hypothetical protein
VNFFSSGPNLAQTLGLVLLEGRVLGSEDRAGTPRAAVINETFVRQHFGGGPAVGVRFGPDVQGKPLRNPYSVVGVVRDARHGSPRQPVPATVYVADAQMEDPWPPQLVVRTPLRAADLTALARQELALLRYPEVAVSEVVSISSLRDATLAQERLVAMLSGFFGLLALLLASVGLYGLMAYSVNRRRSELGVRLAIGASPRSLGWLVVRDTLVLVAAGSVAGVAGALAAARAVRALLYGVEPRDPGTITLAVVVLASVSLLAAWLPARRAAALNPVEALRYE